MSVKDGYNKRVTFDTRDDLEDKIDRLTMMMGKLAARDNRSNRQFKPQIYQSRKGTVWRKYVGQITKESTGQTVQKDEISIGQTLQALEVMQDSIRILRGRIVEGNIETITEKMIIAKIEVGVGPGRDQFLEF